MIIIRTKPVYSKPAEPELMQELGLQLPSKYTTLSQHQAETLKYLRDPEIDVVFNTAMTGDGKSLAAYLPVLQATHPDESVLAMYPTKELIKDQKRQVEKYQEQFGMQKRIGTMDADILDELDTNLAWVSGRGDAIRQATNAEILLTNPDIFHYVMTFRYFEPGKAIGSLPAQIVRYYPQFIFDEFHVFQMPQVVAVLNAMLFIYHQTRKQGGRKFLFLSATPQNMLCRKLERSGMRYQIVKGVYQHADETIPGWRKILNGTTINMVKLGDGNTMESWIRENLSVILDFYAKNPGSKGAIIVNSPMTVKRLKHYFQELMDVGSFPLSFAENTGLTKDADPFSKDLLIGTSTVDIGVDFEVNFLIFESLDEGTFIQRLGRLGRHDGYQKNGQKITFQEFAAYAMLPGYSYQRLETNLNKRTELTREELIVAIKRNKTEENKSVFMSVTDFPRYTKEWGILQTAHVLGKVKDEKTLKSQQAFAQELETACNQVFDVEMESVLRRYYGIVKAEKSKAIVDELMSFRGTSPFDCGVYDTTDDTIKTYNLFHILANTTCQPISAAGFKELLKQRSIPERGYQHVITHLQVTHYNDERENFTLKLRQDLTDCAHDYFHKVVVMKGFFVDVRNPWINDINRTLRKKPVVCLLSRKDRGEIKRKYKLPHLFSVYKVQDEQGVEYSVAFGKEALLLETFLKYVKEENEFWIT